ncbi:MAG: hypothetical protein E7240_01775 [Lachnospiraceae bacterium]|nr:hypothetical protein [Lachnospiraceae bacterium]
MAIITGIKFRTPSKVYYFAPGELQPKYNDHVIVETARGLEYGRVVLPMRDIPEEEIKQPLKEVIRIATKEDDLHERENREKEEEAYSVCQRKIREHELEMKLVAAEYTFDNSKLTFYFTADGRVDFRELVKDLAAIFRTRIELRQIGVRDETKIIGGIGICGRPLCCHAYLHDFAPVSIKMAKEQNLSLNPTKISGTCGRLMCCLKNEAETYEYLNRGLPRKGDGATTPDGLSAEIQSVNILRQTVRVIVDLENDEKEMREYPVSEITFTPKKGRKRPGEEQETVYRQSVPDAEAEENANTFLEEQEELSALMQEPGEEETAAEPEVPEEAKTLRKERRQRKRRRQKADPAESGARKESTGENTVQPQTERAAQEPGAEGAKEGSEENKRRSRRHRSRRKTASGESSETKGNREAQGNARPSDPEDNRGNGGEKADGKNPSRRHRRKRSHSRRSREEGAAPTENEA